MHERVWWIGGGILALLAVAAGAALKFTPLGALLTYGPPVGAGYAAEIVCGGVFVSGRDPNEVMKADVLPANPTLLRRAQIEVDRQESSVTVSLLTAERTALYRPGLGCTLVGSGGKALLLQQAAGIQPMSAQPRPEPWPVGDRVEAAESPAMKAALDHGFAPVEGLNTRAIIVVQNGRIVAERYAEGVNKDMKLLGWSMSKSVTAALIGTLVDRGDLALDAPAPVASWRQATDGRQTITLDHLLNMTSGLSFSEIYAPGDNVTDMLYREDDMAGFAASQPMARPPGSAWAYSTGTANILSGLIFNAAGATLKAVYDYDRTHLFEPAGMTSAVFEPDGSGDPVGGSYLYMTARDWARFGLLYLNGGVMGWQRILSADWVAATQQPIHDGAGKPIAYRRQFWLNSDGGPTPTLRFPHCPADLYMAEGHNGQLVAIIPSAKVVIVRLGWTTIKNGFQGDSLVSEILAALR